ncbi:MAG: hypothetical protein ACTSWW_03580 [Promethearchaeota archaeon]
MHHEAWNIWTEFWQFFDQSPVSYVIGIFLVVLSVYFALWLTYQSIRLTFWLGTEIVRASFFSVAITYYVIMAVFIHAPIVLIVRLKTWQEVTDSVVKNSQNIFRAFYPELDKKIKEEFDKHVHIQRKVNGKHKPIIIETKITPQTSRQEELEVQTEIISHPKTAKKQFFCNNCGSAFSVKNLEVLNKKHETFCEQCGKHFTLKNGVPMPSQA